MSNSKDKNEKFFTGKNRIIICALAAVLLIMIVLVVMDATAGGKLYITNKTDKNITDIMVFFQDYEGNIVDNLYEGSINAGESVKFEYGSDIIYKGTTYECVVLVTFEGEEEMGIVDGAFNSNFGGNIRLKFFKKDGDYYMHAKAGIGVFENSGSLDMDDDIILYFDENDWDYVL